MNTKAKMGDFCTREYFEGLLEASQPQETKENDTGNKESKMEDLTAKEQEKYERLLLLINNYCYNKQEREEIIEAVDELIEEIRDVDRQIYNILKARLNKEE